MGDKNKLQLSDNLVLYFNYFYPGNKTFVEERTWRLIRVARQIPAYIRWPMQNYT
jgi:hypothetical protein